MTDADDFEAELSEYGGLRPQSDPIEQDQGEMGGQDYFRTPHYNQTSAFRDRRPNQGTSTARLPRVSMNIANQGGRDEEEDPEDEDTVDDRFQGVSLPDFEGSTRKTKTPGPAQGISRRAPIVTDGNTIAHKSKFVRTTDVPDYLLMNVDVTLHKEDYGEPGSTEYRKESADGYLRPGPKVWRGKAQDRFGC